MHQAMPLECRGTEEPFVRQNLYVRGWLRMRDLPISDMSEMKGLCRCRVPSETVARNAFNFFLGNLNHCLFFVSHRALLCAYREDERLPNLCQGKLPDRKSHGDRHKKSPVWSGQKWPDG